MKVSACGRARCPDSSVVVLPEPRCQVEIVQRGGGPSWGDIPAEQTKLVAIQDKQYAYVFISIIIPVIRKMYRYQPHYYRGMSPLQVC
jgi:hypothetical protein